MATKTAWSPDSQQIVWIGKSADNITPATIWVIDRDGKHRRLLYLLKLDMTKDMALITWSPDGKSVAVEDESGKTYLIAADCQTGPKGCDASALGKLDAIPQHWLSDFYPQWAGEKINR